MIPFLTCLGTITYTELPLYSYSARLYSTVNHSKTGGGRTVSLWPYSLDILSGWKPLSHVWMISPVAKSPVAFLTNSLTT